MQKRMFRELHTFNFLLAALHSLQGFAVLALSNNRTFPITTDYLTVDSMQTGEGGAPVLVQATRLLADVQLAYLVAAFFFMSAIAHIVIATIYRNQYEADLKKGINKARWIEYSLSASTMIVAIAILTGIYDASTLLLMFGAMAVTNLMGLVMEVHNQTTKRTNWLSFIIGCLTALAPWVVVLAYVLGTNIYGDGSIPTFVYWIYVSIFVFFSLFAVNMYLQYTKYKQWSNYLYGERMYMILSLVAKSALAWQVFAGTLRP